MKMTKSEFVKIADAIKTYYPSEKILPNKQAMQLWYMELEDISYEQASVILRRYVSTNRFPPTIADFREGVAEMSGADGNWSEGWSTFLEAVRKYGYYQKEEALASMDDVTRMTVKRLGWKDLCTSENLMADRANFRMVWEQEKAKAKNNAMLSDGLKGQITALQERKSLENVQGLPEAKACLSGLL